MEIGQPPADEASRRRPGDTCLPTGGRPHQQIDVAVIRLGHLID